MLNEQGYALVLHGLVVTRWNSPLSFNDWKNIISHKTDLFAPILHSACNYATLGFRRVEDDTLSCHFWWQFQAVKMCKEGMLSRKEVEKEIQKINKEIAKLQWDLKNEVLTPRQKVVKQNKIKQLKKTRKGADTTGRRLESPEGLFTEAVRYVRIQKR